MKTPYTKRAKKALVIIALFFCSIAATAQSHILKFACPVYTCDASGNAVGTASIVAPENSKFKTVATLTNGDVLIEFFQWTTPKDLSDSVYAMAQLKKISDFNYTLSGATLNDSLAAAKNAFKDGRHPQKFFIIKATDYSIRVTELSSRWDITAGALAIPIKIRPVHFDFSKDVALAGTAAFGYRVNNKFSVYGIFGLGISSIGIDSTSTAGKTKSTTNLSALTISPGVVAAFERLQVSCNVGWDFLGNADVNKGWIYNKKMWIGIGIGFKLFSPGNDKPISDSKESQK